MHSPYDDRDAILERTFELLEATDDIEADMAERQARSLLSLDEPAWAVPAAPPAPTPAPAAVVTKAAPTTPSPDTRASKAWLSKQIKANNDMIADATGEA